MIKTNRVYHAPKLMLGDTPLVTGTTVLTGDLGNGAILGTDVLRHYCIQLDFTTDTLRFLNPDGLDTRALGRFFALHLRGGHAVISASLLGVSRWVVDTGSQPDAAMNAAALERAARREPGLPLYYIESQHRALTRGAFFSKAALEKVEYSGLVVSRLPDGVTSKLNIIGLGLLARHVVTFNFPADALWLKQVTAEPTEPSDYLTKEAEAFLYGLAERGHLPGRKVSLIDFDLKTDGAESAVYPATRSFSFQTDAEHSTCHYTVLRESKANDWRLLRAWRTEANQRVVEEYPIH
jgi:hypothetical protein